MSDEPIAAPIPEPLTGLWTACETLLLAFDETLDRLDPPGLPADVERLKPLIEALATAIETAEDGPGAPGAKALDEAGKTLLRGTGQVLQAARRFEVAGDGSNHAIMRAFQALRPLSRAREILFGLAHTYVPVSRYFLDPRVRTQDDLAGRLVSAGQRNTRENATPPRGLIHYENAYGKRGGYSLFIPEEYTPERKWPLVVALHGGSGHGSDFLWSWLPAARAFGCIVAACTSRARTWSLQNPKLDAANLNHMLAGVSGKYNIDHDRILLTGISDGGTFSCVLSVVHQVPFTHYAPVAAAVHVMVNQQGQVQAPVAGKRYYIVHGGRDWMFPVEAERRTAEAMRTAGADVTYREIDDLSHNYPADENARIIEWFSPGLTKS